MINDDAKFLNQISQITQATVNNSSLALPTKIHGNVGKERGKFLMKTSLKNANATVLKSQTDSKVFS